MKIILQKHQRLYFTSDSHYMHKNICRGVTSWKNAESVTRNFPTLEDMNDAIVDQINSVVKENDLIFHLGDWSFGGFEYIEEFRDRINCKQIHLILGNHDHHIERNRDNCRRLFSSVNHYVNLLVETHEGKSYNFILMHYPIASWHNMNRGVVHLHGHVHLPPNQKIHAGKAMDVGVDGNDLTPYSLEEILTIMDKRPISKLELPHDHHVTDIR